MNKTKEMENILELAYSQYEKGDYQSSLENYNYFFDNAVKIDSSFVGAKYRALKEWYYLAKKYKPAYDALINKKFLLLKLFEKDKDDITLIEYAQICHVLKSDKEFINLFSKLHDDNINLAKSVYKSVEDILIKNREWKLCNYFIEDSIESYTKLLEQFDELIRISEGAYEGKYNKDYENKFEKDIHNLLWILKIGNRESEINNIILKLKNNLAERNLVIE